jgi:hypothetical protein
MLHHLAALALREGLRRLPGAARLGTSIGIPRSMASTPKRRLAHILDALAPPTETVGTLTLGDITYEVPASNQPSRLPHSRTQDLLDIEDPVNLDNLYFMLRKYLLG